MSEDGGWRDEIVAHRVQLEHLDEEVERTRARLHNLEASLATVRYFGDKVSELSADLRELAEKLETFTRATVRRPSPAGFSAGANWTGVVIAVAALVVAAMK